MKYVAFIPLRGGSKSIPKKNIRPIAGKPLCLWAIEEAARAQRIDHVYVATDSAEIRKVVEERGIPKVTVVDRGAETATDTASTESAMLEFSAKSEFEHIVLIQATSPLITSHDLDTAIAEFEAAGADSLLSAVPQKRFLWDRDASGLAKPRNYDPVKRPRRQEFSAYHVENGAFYVSKKAGLVQTGSRLFGRIALYEMSEDTYLEIDEPSDWIAIEQALALRRRDDGDLASRARRIRIVLSDVDGVLTDSGMYYTDDGDELKKFNTRDGKGFELLRNAGIRTGIITAENTRIVERRAAKLKLDHLVQGSKDKLSSLREILGATGLGLDEVAYIGDDLGDVEILGAVGFAACPKDAVPEARSSVHYVCERNGGEGAVRELAELLLSLR